MAKPFERLYSISITFGVNSQAYGVNSKVMEITPKAWEIEIFLLFPLSIKKKRLSKPDKNSAIGFQTRWRSFDIYEIWTKFE